MAHLEGTKTEKNLLEAFAGESQARNKYTYFASVAKKEGYEEIAEIFLEAAGNEKEHTKIHLKQVHGIRTTPENLKAAISGEHGEFTSMYPGMAADARKEGFEAIAKMFERIGAIEQEHHRRFAAMLKAIEDETVFKKDTELEWKCRNCGHIHVGKEAPNACPVCAHPQSFFEVHNEPY
jgi:rubrerythrin